MKRFIGIMSACFFLVSCGGGGGGSYSELKSKLDNPTGDLEKDNVKNVAAALAQKQQSRPPVTGALASGLSVSGAFSEASCTYSTGSSSVTVTCACDEGGNFEFTSDASDYDQDSGACSTDFRYNSCSMGGGSIDGTGSMYIADCQNAQAGYCFEFSGTVDGEATEISYCVDEQGNIWFLVEVDGAYFAVSGYYDTETGSGEWKVLAVDGEWECSAQNGTGSCVNSNGDSIEF